MSGLQPIENETQLRREVGQRLRAWRLKRSLSQAEVARRAGITQASLSNYETGKREMPISTLLGAAAALDIACGDLLDIPDVLVVRDARIGRAVQQLIDRPELIETLLSAPRRYAVEAAS